MGDYKYVKPSLLHPENWGDPNETVEGFNFNRNDFEDLIDNFVPFESIPVLLQVSHADLDVWCKAIYNMDFKTTYDVLFQRANLYYQKAMFMLSKSGNPTAIKVTAEYYVKLGAVDKESNNITFIGVMPQTESDEEKLKEINKNAAEAAKKAQDGFGGGKI